MVCLETLEFRHHLQDSESTAHATFVSCLVQVALFQCVHAGLTTTCYAIFSARDLGGGPERVDLTSHMPK